MDRARSEEGFGLVELLISMTVLAIGLMALVAAFSSGTFAVNRAIKVSTGGSIADAEIETFKMLIYDNVGVDIASGTLTALDTTYKNDPACYDTPSATNCTQSNSPAAKKLIGPTGVTCATINGWFPAVLPCTPSRTFNGADGRSYRVDTYVSALPQDAPGTNDRRRVRKQLTVVVRDGATKTQLVREVATIDCSTAGSSVSACP